MTLHALEFKNISHTFAAQKKGGQPLNVLKDVSLSITAGEFVSIVGPTGCGKSTLLNVAAGLLAPSSGDIFSFDQRVNGKEGEEQKINQHAGYLFQTDALMPWRNVRQNVLAGLIFQHYSSAHAQALAEEWLRRVGLGGFEEFYPHQLSGGMRRRVSLAQVLVLNPDIILMDEPFSALDIQTRQLMENEVLQLCSEQTLLEKNPRSHIKTNKTVLFITHDLDEAIAMSDRIIIMSAGPASHPIGEFTVDLPKPRDVAEIRNLVRFREIHAAIWAVLKEEVLKTYALQSQSRS